MIGLALPLIGALGVYYLYTAVVLGWNGIRLAPRTGAKGNSKASDRSAQWLTQAGLGGIDVRQFGAVVVVSFVLGSLLAFTVFGGVLPALVVGAFAATFPPASYRLRRRKRQARAREAWPRMIEEMRVLTGALGRSIPQALFEVGEGAPEEMRSAFADGQREWLITTDFGRTVAVLERGLADATADAALETLLVAHEIGGTDLDQRLKSLAEDRVLDVQGRKDAVAKQAGVKFARWFVLLVPAGMAMAGMSVGDGRAAYRTAVGQTIVVFALSVIVGCWLWAGHFMRLPPQQRVLVGRDEPT